MIDSCGGLTESQSRKDMRVEQDTDEQDRKLTGHTSRTEDCRAEGSCRPS